MIATKLARSLGVGDGANGGPNTKHRDTTFGMTRKIAHRLGQFVKPTFSTSGKVQTPSDASVEIRISTRSL